VSRSNILFLIIGALVIVVAVMGYEVYHIASSLKACASTSALTASRLKRIALPTLLNPTGIQPTGGASLKIGRRFAFVYFSFSGPERLRRMAERLLSFGGV